MMTVEERTDRRGQLALWNRGKSVQVRGISPRISVYLPYLGDLVSSRHSRRLAPPQLRWPPLSPPDLSLDSTARLDPHLQLWETPVAQQSVHIMALVATSQSTLHQVVPQLIAPSDDAALSRTLHELSVMVTYGDEIDEMSDALCKSGGIERLVNLLAHADPDVFQPALLILGNLTSEAGEEARDHMHACGGFEAVATTVPGPQCH